MSGLKINVDLTDKIICGFLVNELTKVGFRRGIVGMSGGIDSSLSACLAARALGADHVIGVIMPYRTSNPDSERHARLVADQIGIRTYRVDITPMVDPYFEQFPDASDLRRGNKMARERMTVLYDLSLAENALVIGTSNKTEFLLGYTTLWGDMACALNPLGDLYKTQVRQLSAYLGLPQEIIEKPPSADLWLGQTDEAELGFTYEEVDALLYRMIDQRYRYDELVAEGFAPEFVQRVYALVQGSQYKRKLPLIAKVSHRSIDRDFRYSRDWGK